MTVAYLLVFTQWLIATMFLISAVSKIRTRGAWNDFVQSVQRLAVPSGAPATAVLVVMAELATAGLVLVQPTKLIGLGLAFGLLAGFTVVLARAISRGVITPCRCSGASRTPVSRRHIVRNLVAIGLTLAGGVAYLRSAAETLPAAGWILAAAAGSAAAITLIVADEIVDLFITRPAGRELL